MGVNSFASFQLELKKSQSPPSAGRLERKRQAKSIERLKLESMEFRNASRTKDQVERGYRGIDRDQARQAMDRISNGGIPLLGYLASSFQRNHWYFANAWLATGFCGNFALAAPGESSMSQNRPWRSWQLGGFFSR
jgi:hypothetical protein